MVPLIDRLTPAIAPASPGTPSLDASPDVVPRPSKLPLIVLNRISNIRPRRPVLLKFTVTGEFEQWTRL